MKDVLQLAAVAATVLFIGLVAYGQLYGDAARESLIVRAVEGEVTHATPGEVGVAKIGTRLNLNDRVITGEDGRIELTMGDDA